MKIAEIMKQIIFTAINIISYYVLGLVPWVIALILAYYYIPYGTDENNLLFCVIISIVAAAFHSSLMILIIFSDILSHSVKVKNEGKNFWETVNRSFETEYENNGKAISNHWLINFSVIFYRRILRETWKIILRFSKSISSS